MGGKSDFEVAAVCQRETRALITLDTDFADILAYPPKEFPGLIVLRLRQQDNSHVTYLIRRLLQILSSESPAGQLWIVEEEQMRIRE